MATISSQETSKLSHFFASQVDSCSNPTPLCLDKALKIAGGDMWWVSEIFHWVDGACMDLGYCIDEGENVEEVRIKMIEKLPPFHQEGREDFFSMSDDLLGPFETMEEAEKAAEKYCFLN